MAPASSESNRGFGSSQSNPVPGCSSQKQNKHAFPNPRPSGVHKQLYEDHVLPLLAAGRSIDAEPALNLLFQSHTPIPDVYKDLMALAESRGDLHLVEIYCKHWLAHPSSNLQILQQQAREADLRGFHDLAFPLYLSILNKLPYDIEFISPAVCYLIRQERFEEARSLLFDSEVLKLNSDSFLIGLAGICAFELGFLVEAARLVRISLAIEPSSLAHVALAAILDAQGSEEIVLYHLETASNISVAGCSDWLLPRLSVAIYLRRRNFSYAQHLLEIALSEQPVSQTLRHLFGELLLLQGDLTAGFNVWAHIDKIVYISQELNCKLPYFQDTLSNSKPYDILLLVANSTLGDTLLFSRYALWLSREKFFIVKFFIQPPLCNFLRNSLPSSVDVLPLNQLQFQRKGRVLSLLAAPTVFGACDQFPILKYPCLKADSELVDIWRSRLSLRPEDQLIGINWHGSPMQSLKESVSSDIPLDCFSPLADLPNCRLVSLQKGFGKNQLKRCSFLHRFVECQPEITNENRFEWIAALISICNWVVCDDSGPAHLAGSLNVPTLLLATNRLGWRWQGPDDESFWYPSVKIIGISGSNWNLSISRACEIISLGPTI